MRDIRLVEKYLADMLVELGIDITSPNFTGTPERFAEWLLEFTKTNDELRDECDEFASAVFPHNREDMIVSDPFIVYSMCPHHFLPVEFKVIVGYIPKGHVVGLSKLVRITDAVAKQAELQEEFTPKLADILCGCLKTPDVAVRVKGTHSCMKIRGVKNGPSFTNTALRGGFRSVPEVRKEFYDLIGGEKK
jgi:GTP cyclohydrolase I